jgi:hypothetical protein
MLAASFRVAMHNTIAMASYDRPDLTNPPGNEWLIDGLRPAPLPP